MTAETKVGEIQTCPHDGEPVVFTFEFPGAEYVCVVCGWLGGVGMPARADATPELQERHGELLDLYEVARAARSGRAPVARPRQDGPRPVCRGCGATAEGRMDHSGKPAHWFARTREGVTQYACSRNCADGPVLPW